ncbi:MAG: response regulator [Gammaproteobacteria bacterium]|nr:response regulator [Gammaproteobacteria bacterium]
MRFRIKYQILLIAMIPVLLIDILFTYINIVSSINQAEQLLKSKGEIIAQQISDASEYSLLSGRFEQIHHLLDQSINTNNILFLAVYDTEGAIIAQAESTQYKSSLSSEYSYYRQSIQTENIDFEDIFQPDVNQEGIPLRNLGWVHMYISKDHLLQKKEQIIKDGAIIFIAMLIIAIILTLSISRRLIRPIYTLLHHLKQIETGQLGEIIHPVEGNEIGDVQKGFNSMSQALLANRMQLDQKIKTATLELMNAITNLEYNNRELAIARDNAQKSDQVKTQFLANMSHEIRTPINGIKGFINLLSNTGLNRDQNRYVDIITRSTIDLSNIVNEILDFSKIESGKVELIENSFDLVELVESTRNSLFASTLEKNIDLFLTIYSDTPRYLIGDQMRLKQILINVIGNAIKFTDKGFVSITVYMEDESENQIMIKFNIEDSGIGISDDNQKSLFKAFKQIESDSNRRFSGTGLGLVISKNLASLMGGDIILHSEVDSGTLFSIIIPLKPSPQEKSQLEYHENDLPTSKTVMIYASTQPALNEIQALFNRNNFNTETQLIEETTSAEYLQNQLTLNLNYIDIVVIDLRHSFMHPNLFIPQQVVDKCKVIIMHYDLSIIDISDYPDYQFISVINNSNNLIQLIENQKTVRKRNISIPVEIPETLSKRILIVDDNSINLALACELTRLWGHSPEQASNATEAMQLFKSMSFDLILLDIQMPEVDGVELMLMMRKQQPELTTPIVAITANVLDMERERLLSLGFNAYISKPIDEKNLQELLSQEVSLQEPVPQQILTDNLDISIDFNLTLILSANNEKLVDATFSMLQLEIPDYLEDLEKTIKATDRDKLSSIMHKLQGITCYIGLPRLKKLLTDYEILKLGDIDDLIDISNQIKDELNRIDEVIELDKQTTESD